MKVNSRFRSMGRHRKTLGPEIEAEIATRTTRGESAKDIHTAIRGALSLAAIKLRQRELRGKAVPYKRAPDGSLYTQGDTQGVNEELSEAHTPDELNFFVDRLKRALAQAETDGNLGAIASISGRVTALMALKHRTAPLPKEDPNDRLDFVELALSGEAKLLKLLNELPTPE
jgi:hypothetical protein